MPQNLFEPRHPFQRERPPGFAPGLQPPPQDAPPQGVRPEAAAEPSWVRVYWNTLRSFFRRRLGLGPRPPAGNVPPSALRSPVLIAAAVAVIIAAVGAGSLLTAAKHRSRPATAGARTGTAGAPGAVPSPAVRTVTAQWIIDNIGPGQLVACDAALCGTLSSLGFPASSLVPVQDSALALQNADVAVVTGTLRARLGTTLTAMTAAEPLAAFGTGVQTVTVQAVAHAGRAAYARQLQADLQQRRRAGSALLANGHLLIAAEARAELGRGLVDTRVCAILAILSSGHTLVVASFGAAATGAGADVARVSLEISTIDHRSASGTGAPARALRALIAAQQPPYLPLRTAAVQTAGSGSPVGLVLQYSQPAPLGAPDGATP